MLISVIIPSYNYRQYLKEALESVVRQSFQDFEIIIVDDGSQPEVYQFVEGLAKCDSRIRICTHPDRANRGLSETIQLGIKNSRGKWIAVLEADDIWAMDCLSARKGCMNEDVSIVVNNIYSIVSKGCSDAWFNSYVPRVMLELALLRTKKKQIDLFQSMLWENMFPTFSSVMFRKELAEKVNWNCPVKGWVDWYVWAQMCRFGAVAYCPQKLTGWRIHQDSQNRKKEGIRTYLRQYSCFRESLYFELRKTSLETTTIDPLKLPFFIPLGRRAFLSAKQIGFQAFLKSVLKRLNS